MKNINWLEEFRRQLGSKDFKEAPCSTVTAQFIHHFIFIEAPKEVQLCLFEDFVSNFWAEEMPTTDCHYHMHFEPIPESVMRKMESEIAETLNNMVNELIVLQVDARVFATEIFRAIQDINSDYKIYVINTLILSPISIPYRYVYVDTVITMNDIRKFIEKGNMSWELIRSLVLGFNTDSIGNALVLWELIKSHATQEERVVAFFLSASEIVFLTRNGTLPAFKAKNEADACSIVHKFQDDYKYFIENCFASVKQERYGNNKFRNFLDQSSHILSEIQKIEHGRQHIALQSALFAYFIGVKNGWDHLPCRVPLPQSSKT